MSRTDSVRLLFQVTPQTFFHVHPGCSRPLRPHKSFSACLLGREYGESFLLMLANVLQVLLWGSVIAGHLRHRRRGRELLRWAAKGDRGDVCAGNEEHTCAHSKISVCTPGKPHTHFHTLLLRSAELTCREQYRTLKERAQISSHGSTHWLVYLLLTTNAPILLISEVWLIGFADFRKKVDCLSTHGLWKFTLILSGYITSDKKKITFD